MKAQDLIKQPIVRPTIILMVLLTLIAAMSACTRERPAWPEATPGFSLPTRQPTPAVDAVERVVEDSEAAGGDSAQVDRLPVSDLPLANDVPVVPPATELTPRPPTPTPEPPTFNYTVEAGDTLVSIGRQYGVDVAAIIQLNDITDPNSLKVGQQLRIPGTGSGTTTASGGGVHVVQSGETLFSIARRYNVSVDRLAAANNITDPDSLLVGQELRIPQGTGVVSSSGVRIHVVQVGETLSAIAARYGVSSEAIMQANDISDANTILAGSQLTIP